MRAGRNKLILIVSLVMILFLTVTGIIIFTVGTSDKKDSDTDENTVLSGDTTASDEDETTAETKENEDGSEKKDEDTTVAQDDTAKDTQNDADTENKVQDNKGKDNKKDRLGNIPSDLKSHYLIQSRNSGVCTSLRGKVLFAFVFVNDSESNWTESERKEAKTEIASELSKLKEDASSYGISVTASTKYYNSSVNYDIVKTGSAYEWETDALMGAGLLPMWNLHNDLKNENSVDEVVVVFLVDKDGRSMAVNHSFFNAGEGAEYALVFDDFGALRHEIYHCFGAHDFYYPDKITEASDKYLPGSIMREGRNGTVDSFTAYLMGWTDKLSNSAESFLYAVKSVTKEDIDSSRKDNMVTGNVTDYEYDNGLYTGQMESGVPNGYGKHLRSDGSIYEGDWAYGKYHGEGSYYWKNGDKYSGSWVNNKREGKGTLTFASGATYSGDWTDDKRTGKGTYTWTDGTSYVGDFVDGEFNGYGTQDWLTGEVYTGYWKDGMQSGQGTLTWPSGSVYEGNWENNGRNGEGTMTWSDGKSYTGSWKDDKRHGQGTMKWSGGDTYTGEWSEDKLNGYGTYTWASGKVYAGYWSNNLMHGEGTMTYPDGRTQKGTWKDDKFVG